MQKVTEETPIKQCMENYTTKGKITVVRAGKIIKPLHN